MASPIALRLNGQAVRADVEAQTPLLYALRNELGQRGPRWRESRTCGTPAAAARRAPR